MSFLTEIFSASNQPVDAIDIDPARGVMGATGLGRAQLATLFRQKGLFGREADLSPVEQAMVQARLGPIPGLRSRPVLAPTDARLISLESFTDSVVHSGGRSSATAEAQLVAAGYSSAAVNEVVRVVRLARDVFGIGTAANDAPCPRVAA